MQRMAYSNFNGSSNEVEYGVFSPVMCVFSGIMDNGTSTVNAAERIIQAIAEKEQMPLRFYDLQTKRGYSYFREGEYSFNLLTVVKEGEELRVTRWTPVLLPDFIKEAFCASLGLRPQSRDFKRE